uniref:CSON014947 protein n=1 Tax=Culicoides sonorensis TaxID=179676 RepID=A0A336LS08_CULSO
MCNQQTRNCEVLKHRQFCNLFIQYISYFERLKILDKTAYKDAAAPRQFAITVDLFLMYRGFDKS